MSEKKKDPFKGKPKAEPRETFRACDECQEEVTEVFAGDEGVSVCSGCGVVEGGSTEMEVDAPANQEPDRREEKAEDEARDYRQTVRDYHREKYGE